MLTRHTLNWEMSKAVYDDCQALIKPKRCYYNIYQIVNGFNYFEKFKSAEWRVAYGYLQLSSGLFCRHCFILDKDDAVIDPTIVLTKKENEQPDYIAFAIINAADWFDLIKDDDFRVSLDNTFLEEEKRAHEYAKAHNLWLIG